MVDIDVGGEVKHSQSGAKSTIGVASDQLVLYYDVDKPAEAMRIIEHGVKLHNYMRELKSGMIPAHASAPSLETKTKIPPKAE
jgi:hypothetical protein